MGLEKCFAPFYTISSLHFHFTPPENIKNEWNVKNAGNRAELVFNCDSLI